VFADAITGGRGGGEFPFAAAQGKKGIANPIGNGPDAGDGFTGMGIEGLDEFGHLGQSVGAAHRGARSQDLAAAAPVLPPEGDPVPRAAGFAFLETAALKAAAAWGCGCGDRDVVHDMRTIASESETIESFRCGMNDSVETTIGLDVQDWNESGKRVIVDRGAAP